MFGFYRNWKRKRLKQKPFPRYWEPICRRYLPFYRQMDPDAQETFRENLKLFVWEKSFIGAGGMRITDTVKVVIAGAAVRLIQHLDLSFYDRLSEIVVYPHDFQHPKHRSEIRLGEAHTWGVVVLSWPAVIDGLRNPCDGWDTAAHEFAHVLDRDGGAFDGTPKLRADAHYRAWAQVMSQHYAALRAGSPKEHFVMRGYGAKNEAEFFAVATESFFEKPRQMKKLTPDLYAELERFYGFDPAKDSRC